MTTINHTYIIDFRYITIRRATVQAPNMDAAIKMVELLDEKIMDEEIDADDFVITSVKLED